MVHWLENGRTRKNTEKSKNKNLTTRNRSVSGIDSLDINPRPMAATRSPVFCSIRIFFQQMKMFGFVSRRKHFHKNSTFIAIDHSFNIVPPYGGSRAQLVRQRKRKMCRGNIIDSTPVYVGETELEIKTLVAWYGMALKKIFNDANATAN